MNSQQASVPPSDDDEAPYVFDESEDLPATELSHEKPWKLMIVDDDSEIHNISHLVLRDFSFEGRPLQLISAHSGAAAKTLIAAHPDTAIMLLDVVMETDNAGLDVVRHVRDELKNNFVRIILRTGQPGQAPERSVVIDYDINDYKEKTELTAQKLVTTVVSALRAYRDMQIIENSRHGLEQIINASCNLFEPQSLAQFSSGVLQQLSSLLNLGEDSLYMQHSGFSANCMSDCEESDFRILSGNGQFANCVGQSVRQVVPTEIQEHLAHARKERRTLIDNDSFIGYFRTSNGSENLVYLKTRHRISELDTKLLQVFAVNVGIAFDNIHLNEELADTQAEIILTLSEVVETRSHETGRHVYRVGAYSRLLGELIGLSKQECDLLQMAAPMHDVGKIGIPDAVLNKPGRYTSEEFEQMKHHAAMGRNILKGSLRLPLRSAAIIAGQHHEHWDGSGYPMGLIGEEIHIFGRIVALADVFDALCNARVYKEAWPLDTVIAHVKERAGTQFDPQLIAVFLEHIDRFVAILNDNPNDAA